MNPRTPLHIAVIGAGPSGIHAAEMALCHGMRDIAEDVDVRVDLIDSLPTATGLVRAHSPIDGSVEAPRLIEQEHVHAHLRFIGNLTVGADVPARLLTEYYDAVVTTVGPLDPAVGFPAPGQLDLRSLHATSAASPVGADDADLVSDLRDAGLPVTTWHGWYRLDESVRRGRRGWERAVARAHAIPVMP